MPRVEASWVLQDQDLAACANTQPEEQSPSCCQMDQLWEKGWVEFLSSENQLCPGSDLLLYFTPIHQVLCFPGDLCPHFMFCRNKKAQSRLLGKTSFVHCPFPCSRMLLP